MGNFGYFVLVTFYSFSTAQAILSLAQDEVVQQELHNIFLKDNDDLKVDLDINEDDYEMFSKHSTKALRIMNEDKIFQEFDRIASKEYERVMARNRADTRAKDVVSESIMKELNNRTPSKASPTLPLSHTRKRNATNEKLVYKYLVTEYCAQVIDDDTIYKPAEIGQPKSGLLDSLKKITSFNTSHNCTEEDLKGIGIKAINCLVAEFYTRRQDYKALAQNLSKIAAIWTAVYLLIAVPLWCTKGWCSCLCCKFFKPQQTIQEAKNYLLLNPPGVLVTERGTIIQYEPTERERDCYEEFGHFLRTL